MFSSCGNRNEDNSIKYDGTKTINIVLLEELALNATSNLPITYYSDNELVVTVTPNGTIKGKNIGEANVTISNTENDITIKVIVSLLEEPTVDFGASKNEIINLYGAPQYNIGDSIYIYGGGEVHPDDWYSFAVWRMDFFFVNDQYVESDLYIEKDLDSRLNEFLSKYNYRGIVTDTTGTEEIEYHIYLNNENPDEASVLIGKIYDVGKYKDICLFYIPYTPGRSSGRIAIPERVRNNIGL